MLKSPFVEFLCLLFSLSAAVVLIVIGMLHDYLFFASACVVVVALALMLFALAAVPLGIVGLISSRFRRRLCGRLRRILAVLILCSFGCFLLDGLVFWLIPPKVGGMDIRDLVLIPLAAVLLTATIGFYVFIYTIWLKRRTPQNIVIGGASGAIPPVIGWAAVTGDIGVGSLILFAIIFLWTPPHFWALALFRQGDYAKAGIPMLPVVAGGRETRKQILIYSLILVPVSLLPVVFALSGAVYGVAAVLLGAGLLRHAVAVWRDDTDATARPMFFFTITYLFLIFVFLLVDRAVSALF